MTGGWSTPCDGGIWWDKPKTQLTAIANELFLSVAAHIANRVEGEEKESYLGWAQAEWDWFSNSGLINGENVINDGLDHNTCQNDGDTVWSYNQGVILGALAELAKATGDGKYTDEAKRIADAAMQKLSQDGILTEPVDSLDEQSAQFKGAFVRGLAALNGQAPEQAFADYLKRNADSAWERGKNGEDVIRPNWSGEEQGPAGTTSHAAGVDVLVAAAQVA
jgi:predicted alpha-1,6-mannanase (GH76 family)